MELKNALAVSLIALCSATLVVLIARVLDLQAAKRLEPRLDRIIEELEAMRVEGSLVATGTERQAEASSADGLTVYYFHSSTRCPTCESIESQSRAVVQTDFRTNLESGELQWKVLNYEAPGAAEFAQKFEIQIPVVVLAKRSRGEITHWKRLDRVWALFDDEPEFAKFLRDEIRQMLSTAEPQQASLPSETEEELQSEAASPLTDIPIPNSDEIPVPD